MCIPGLITVWWAVQALSYNVGAILKDQNEIHVDEITPNILTGRVYEIGNRILRMFVFLNVFSFS